MYYVTNPDPDRIAYIGAATLTFGDLSRNAYRIVQMLRITGLEPGHVVAVATTDTATFFVCFAACHFGGYTMAVIDPHAAPRELSLALEKAKPRAFFAEELILTDTGGIIADDSPWHTWRVEGFSGETGMARFSCHGLNDVLPELDAMNELGSLGRDLTAHPRDLLSYLIFTSGTTSNPKAVSISRHALQTHIRTLAQVFGYNTTAKLLSYMPTHHTDGLVHGVAAPLFTGMTVVHPGPFDTSADLKTTLRANKITHFLAVPTMLSIIRHGYSNCRDLFNYEEFQNLVSTAGFLHKDFWAEFQDFFNVRVSNFYGLTETVSGSLYCGPDDNSFQIGTVGKPVDAGARIVDVNGSEVPPNEIGELQVSGDHLMSGYLDDPEATQAVLHSGWLSTGDLFTRDEGGFFRIVGRKKNTIKRGGVSVYPEDLQQVLRRMPGIVDVEVVGLPDVIFEEIIVVCAVLQDGTSEDEVRAFCRYEFAKERQPDKIIVMEQLPRGPSGKVQRSALVAQLRAAGATPPTDGHSIRERVIELAARVFAVPMKKINAGSSPGTVESWDSYAGMEFVMSLEKEFKVKLQAEDFMRILNIGLAIEVISDAVEKENSSPGNSA